MCACVCVCVLVRPPPPPPCRTLPAHPCKCVCMGLHARAAQSGLGESRTGRGRGDVPRVCGCECVCLRVGSPACAVLQLWNPAKDWSVMRTLSGHTSAVACLSPFHGYLVSAGHDAVVHQWDPDGPWRVVRSLAGGALTGQVHALTSCLDHLVTATSDGAIVVSARVRACARTPAPRENTANDPWEHTRLRGCCPHRVPPKRQPSPPPPPTHPPFYPPVGCVCLWGVLPCTPPHPHACVGPWAFAPTALRLRGRDTPPPPPH